MNLKKAIEIITDLTHYSYTGNPQDELDALTMGISALKYVSTIRQAEPGHSPGPLLGETKD